MLSRKRFIESQVCSALLGSFERSLVPGVGWPHDKSKRRSTTSLFRVAQRGCPLCGVVTQREGFHGCRVFFYHFLKLVNFSFVSLPSAELLNINQMKFFLQNRIEHDQDSTYVMLQERTFRMMRKRLWGAECVGKQRLCGSRTNKGRVRTSAKAWIADKVIQGFIKPSRISTHMYTLIPPHMRPILRENDFLTKSLI